MPLPPPSAPPAAGAAEPGLSAIGTDVPTSVALVADQAESKALFGDQQRTEQLKQVFHWAFLWLVRVAAGAFIAVFVVRALHFVLPENNAANARAWFPHGWLTDSQLQSIDKFFFSGALGAFAVRYVGQVLPAAGSAAKKD